MALQPDVQPQASLLAGAAFEVGGFWGPAQERAVGNFDRADQSAALSAGRRPHFLHHGSGALLCECIHTIVAH